MFATSEWLGRRTRLARVKRDGNCSSGEPLGSGSADGSVGGSDQARISSFELANSRAHQAPSSHLILSARPVPHRIVAALTALTRRAYRHIRDAYFLCPVGTIRVSWEMATLASPPPTVDVDPFDDAFLADPYPSYRRLRDTAAMVRLPAYEVCGVARFEQVQAILKDPETFCSSAGIGLTNYTNQKPWRTPSLLLETDPPRHTVTRRVFTEVLSLGRVRSLKESFAERAERIVDRLVAARSFDGVQELAEEFPLTVFPEAIGLAPSSRDKMLRYGSMGFNALGPQNHHYRKDMAGADEMHEWAQDLCHRDNLGAGGLGAEVYDKAAEAGFSAEDASLLVRSFLSAGVDTTAMSLGNALFCLATNPAQWARLRDDSCLARSAFDEAVRYESPFQVYFRTTTQSTTITGTTVPANQKVMVFVAAANRDPRQFTDPERFDIDRRPNGHVGFGTGIHACAGQMLARLEGEVVLKALAQRVDSIEVAGSVSRRLHNTLRGLNSLPLRVKAV